MMLRRRTVAMTVGCLLATGATALGARLPSIDMPATATVGNTTITTEAAAKSGLNCALTSAGLSCHRTLTEAQAAVGAERSTPSSAAAVVAAACSPPMTLWTGASFTGTSLTIGVQSTWVNLGTYGFSNVTSSWSSGCVGGYLADGTNGAGTRIGLPSGSSQASLGAFDNKASSVLRCPC